MRFGVATFVTDEGIRPADLGRTLEERGFESLFIAEHTHIPVHRESPWPEGDEELPRNYYRTLDPLVPLMAAAGTTERLLLATGILLLIERDPIIAAKEIASLDFLSGGRVIMGVGAGWNLEEMRNHGTDPGTRMALLRERVLAMKAARRGDGPRADPDLGVRRAARAPGHRPAGRRGDRPGAAGPANAARRRDPPHARRVRRGHRIGHGRPIRGCRPAGTGAASGESRLVSAAPWRATATGRPGPSASRP
jgi:alkanesulfonate monooxygenase SsuD/methylene tetrahydromethanopterin reductase-like flavin-dependent oxidoreductase (luciferase family)